MKPTLEMIETQLMLGNVDIAGRLISLLETSEQVADQFWILKQIVRRLESCDAFAKAGEFDHAFAELAAMESHCPDWPIVAQKRTELSAQRAKLQIEMDALFAAQELGRWGEAAVAAQRAQRICPKLPIARLMRKKGLSQPRLSIAEGRPSHHTQVRGAGASSRRNVRVSDDSGVESKSERFMIWIDGVGGFLGCLAPILTIGQAIPGSHVDIPIQADLSRRHAVLRRSGEGYAIDPLHDCKINGRLITEATHLLDGDEIALGEKVKLRFGKKHSLSASARLDFVSRHRTHPSADCVLLMAESLVIGPRSNSHVVCRDWTSDVILFRRGEALACRSTAPICINGQQMEGKPNLPFGANLTGDGFSMTLERLP